jgi:GDP-L-fucose synthase
MNRTSRIYVAGGDTLIGAALRERLSSDGYRKLVGTPPDEPDLTVMGQVEDFFGEARPEYVIVAAGLSGGIRLNQERPAELMLHNLLVAAHVIDSAHRHGVAKLLYLASSCGYPRSAPQPLAVESLLAGPPEPTSVAYATAKLAGWQLCDAYRRQHGARFVTGIPANAFGPHDDFSPDGGHVIPALIRRAYEAKLRGEPTLTVWGTGAPRREFIFARDLADACLFVMRHYDGPEPINLGGGAELSIAEVAHRLRALGWRPSVDFLTGLTETYDWFVRHAADPIHRFANRQIAPHGGPL